MTKIIIVFLHFKCFPWSNLSSILYIIKKVYIYCCMYSVPHSITPRLWNTGLVSRGASLTSWTEGSSLAMVGHPSSDGVSIKMPYRVDVFINQLCTPSFPIGLVKTNLCIQKSSICLRKFQFFSCSINVIAQPSVLLWCQIILIKIMNTREYLFECL